jgi:hypothetical protein
MEWSRNLLQKMNRQPGGQEISCSLWNSKVHYCVYNTIPAVRPYPVSDESSQHSQTLVIYEPLYYCHLIYALVSQVLS